MAINLSEFLGSNFRGDIGVQGAQGLSNQGVQGTIGIQGDLGVQGTVGPQGSQGIVGTAANTIPLTYVFGL